MATEPGPLVASGRDGDIFELGPGLVLRRAKSGRSIEHEARTMAYAREHGYPVPEVHEVRAGGTEIVMERVEGPMMMDAMLRRPWRMPGYARQLADLHDRLHAIPAPEWLPDAGGDRLVHLDLHPMNVMVTATGPVVIDWTNAARGEPLLDVALTVVLLTCPQMPGSDALNALMRAPRGLLASMFSRRYRGGALDAQLARAAELKTLDPNMSAAEVAACARMGARAGRRAARRA